MSATTDSTVGTQLSATTGTQLSVTTDSTMGTQLLVQ